MNITINFLMFGWRKACEELTKRLDPELPFYYHTSTHHRCYERELPDFSQSRSKPRKECIARRELLTSNIGSRVTMASSICIHVQYHNIPVELPPPPNMPGDITDHSYF